MDREKLSEILSRAGPEGPLDRVTLEDAMAVVFLRSYQQTPIMSDSAQDLVTRFFERAGVRSTEDAEQLDAVLKRYFESRPLDGALVAELSEALAGGEAQLAPMRAGYAIGSAFSPRKKS